MKPPSSILAFDSSTAACSAALWRDGATRAHRLQPMTRGHAEVLMPIILEVLAQAGARFADLDAIAVTVGPGSFTGLRIGLSVARGIALAAGLPIIGVTTFAAVAEAIPVGQRQGLPILVLLDSKRAELYCQLFSTDFTPSGPPMIAEPAEVARLLPAGQIVLAGDGVSLAQPFLPVDGAAMLMSTGVAVPDAAFIGPLACRLAERGAGLPAAPLYLRAPDVQPAGSKFAPGAPGADRPEVI